MTDREKRLLYFLLIVGFLVLNAGAVNFLFLPQLREAKRAEERMKDQKLQAEIDLADQEFRRDEIDWLIDADAKGSSSAQKALASLEALANREATRLSLTVKRRKPMEAVNHPALHYNRARVEVEVSGREEALYRWIDRLNSPSELRAATMIRLNPNRDDDTMIDCLLVIEQWFVPETDDLPDA